MKDSENKEKNSLLRARRIPGFPNYSIDHQGTVYRFSIPKRRKLKPYAKFGELWVQLYRDKVRTWMSVKKAMALTYCDLIDHPSRFESQRIRDPKPGEPVHYYRNIRLVYRRANPKRIEGGRRANARRVYEQRYGVKIEK